MQQTSRTPVLPRGSVTTPKILQEGESTGFTVTEPMSVMGADGRTYHGYDEGAYLLPNDALEQDRLDLQHAMCTLLLDRQFGLAPFRAAPKKVLDIATGTGIWALEYARQHPEADVVGTDLSLIQPQPDVPNCEFIRENSETSEWIFPYFFDYIHARYIISCFDDTRTVIRKAFDHLEPGGWIEIMDPDFTLQFDNEDSKHSALARWTDLFNQSLRNIGRDPNKATRYQEWFREAGFRDVEQKVLLAPNGAWVDEPKLKKVGMFGRADGLAVLKSTGKMFQLAGMSIEETRELALQGEEELRSGSVHIWNPFYIVYGRKPLESEMTDAQKTEWEVMKRKVLSNDNK